MKSKYLILGLFFFVLTLKANPNDLEYSIINFPDSVYSDSNLTFQIIIKNASKNPIQIKKMPVAVDIFIQRNNNTIDNHRSSCLPDEFMFFQLTPGDSIKKLLDFQFLSSKDTIVCPPKNRNYIGCVTKIDSLIANVVGMCHQITVPKTLSTGIYKVVFYINIVNCDDKKDYFRIIKELKILKK